MRAARLVVAVPAVALARSACGSEAAQELAERSPNPIVAAAGKAADEETARLSLSMTIPGAPQPLAGEGVFDLVEGDEGTITFTAPGSDRVPMSTEIRVVDGTTFVQDPTLEQRQPGKRWLRMDDEGSPLENPTGSFTAQNPMEMVRLLESAADFTEEGTTEVRGEPAQLWRGTLDLAELVPSEEPGAGSQLQELGLSELPVEVAIDDEDRLRRVAFTLDFGAMTEARGEETPPATSTELVFTVELFDFGTPIGVEALPEAEVTGGPALPVAEAVQQ